MTKQIHKPFALSESYKPVAEIDLTSEPPVCLKDGTPALGFPYEKCSGCPALKFCLEWHFKYFDNLNKKLHERSAEK